MIDTKIQTVVASAGAGKTTRIVGSIVQEVARRDPEQIIATTFTVKAADELIERSRTALFKSGNAGAAARLLGARFGTVNSVCGQIVSEFAIDLGRSPRAEIIPEESVTRTFAIAANAAIEKHAPSLNALADALGYTDPKLPSAADRSDWRSTVRRIIELARANGISAADLGRSAKLSRESFLALLTNPTGQTAEAYDRDLSVSVHKALSSAPVEVSKTGAATLETLRQAAAALRAGRQISWSDWARLSKLGCAKKDGAEFLDALSDVTQAACRHPEHPRLHQQCSDFIDLLFECAADALDAFQTYKSERGLLDFTDQEMLALEVLQDNEMREQLREKVGCVFVDEFQDSSPLQISIFTALADLVDSSTWVGDPKQAIYGFRNADCTLTQAAFEGVAASSSAARDVLATSYRSRKGIIEFANSAFEPAFSAMGLPPEEHSFAGAARGDGGFDKAPLSVWWLAGKNIQEQHAALASGVKSAIEAGTVVTDKSGAMRPLTAGDVAILCRTKAHLASLSKALSQAGLKVAVELDGLLRTPQVELVMAAYRWAADPSDRAALAELARYFSADPQSDLWLQAAGAQDADAALSAAVPIAGELAALRERLLTLTPADLLDAIIALPAVFRQIEGWGDCVARLDDLEALRGYARAYEAGCAASGVPATPSAFILWLASENPQRPKSRQGDAVKLMTYHGAKGLEWPFVILTGLHQAPKPRLFEPVAEAESEIDWKNPLAGRWIRFWPWPYGSQSKNVHLDVTSLNSELGKASLQRAQEEDTRLLYVGVTRARDYLCFAPPDGGKLEWLSVLDTGAGPHLQLPVPGGEHIQAGTHQFPAVVDAPPPSELVSRAKRPSFVRPERTTVTRPALHRRPSTDSSDRIYQVVERVELGSRVPVTGAPDMQRVGEAVHAIFASDTSTPGASARLERAEAILERWRVHEVNAADIIGACDRLNAYISRTWPDGKARREAPIFAGIEQQLVSGRIDLLMEDDEGYSVIDHKTFPGSRDLWDARAVKHGPQLGLYAEALQVATGRRCERVYVHMPLVGALLRIAAVDGSTSSVGNSGSDDKPSVQPSDLDTVFSA
ncbi:UvrD-helicase domain-containing protein [Devosia sp. RR2S18]|uniref:UvrD-helicase domain-containing protein n=1 Tax=Devosia rhizosphaerae TaxID=3049774 RepID=UPI002541A8EB|nr:UvrD-helicase domain-containing protein [Devosia sp. RR2S18]WIJ25785.1 UvrD-helicase domain-containing protein [Devosia sp. RR2S18]